MRLVVNYRCSDMESLSYVLIRVRNNRTCSQNYWDTADNEKWVTVLKYFTDLGGSTNYWFVWKHELCRRFIHSDCISMRHPTVTKKQQRRAETTAAVPDVLSETPSTKSLTMRSSTGGRQPRRPRPTRPVWPQHVWWAACGANTRFQSELWPGGLPIRCHKTYELMTFMEQPSSHKTLLQAVKSPKSSVTTSCPVTDPGILRAAARKYYCIFFTILFLDGAALIFLLWCLLYDITGGKDRLRPGITQRFGLGGGLSSLRAFHGSQGCR